MIARIKNSLTVRILFWFLVISLIPLITISFLAMVETDSSLGKAKLNSLNAISLGAEEAVATQIKGEIKTLEALALQDSFNPESFKNLDSKELTETLIMQTNKELENTLKKISSFSEIFILDDTGLIVASSDKTRLGVDRSTDSYYTETKKMGKHTLSKYINQNLLVT
ncbi:PDC sensor domain-containing protein [Patescibacteria group bacterium]|nr:PDC sensor domain-containing protein [Patescibacteria group bacterium]